MRLNRRGFLPSDGAAKPQESAFQGFDAIPDCKKTDAGLANVYTAWYRLISER